MSEIAWAAGLFEGEGCISLRTAGKGGTLVLRTTDPDVLDRFVRAVGDVGTVRGPLPIAKPHHKPSYEWRVSKWAHIVQILEDFRPWLGQRRLAKVDDLLAQPVGLSGRQGQTHCLRGHPLDGPDADVRDVILKDGRRQRNCRPCTRERKRLRTATQSA